MSDKTSDKASDKPRKRTSNQRMRYLIYFMFCVVWTVISISTPLSEDTTVLGAVILAAGWLSGYKEF